MAVLCRSRGSRYLQAVDAKRRRPAVGGMLPEIQHSWADRLSIAEFSARWPHRTFAKSAPCERADPLRLVLPAHRCADGVVVVP